MAQVFEFSPPKRAKKKSPEGEVDQEYEILFLAPFRPPPKIIFHNAKVNVPMIRRLIIRNPSGNSMNGELADLPEEDRGLQFSFTTFNLAAGEETILEITWIPSEAGNWRNSIPVRTTSKFKSEIVIVCNSINPQAQKNVRKPVPSKTSKPTVLAKKLVMAKHNKHQSPKASTTRSVVQQHVKFARSLPRTTSSSPCRRQTFLVNPENKENSPVISKPLKAFEKPRHDISRRFEDFVLSPLQTNTRQARSSALDDLVMSPVVLPSGLVRSDVDFVDGDMSATSKAMVPVFEDSENVPPSALRRATFDVGNGYNSVTRSENIVIPDIHLPVVEDALDDLYDSLEEPEKSPPIKRNPSPHKSSGAEIRKPYDALALPEVRDSFMNSTIKFDLPLPSEDPRRCSTGVKAFPASESEGTEKVRKDLFYMHSSSDTKDTDCSFALALDVSQPMEYFGGGVPVSAETCSNDRLSTSTYIKDRLSTETYVKDRLSTETYTKEQHSRGLCRLSTETYVKEQNSRGSCNMNEDSCEEAVKFDRHSFPSAYSPKTDDSLHHDKSPRAEDLFNSRSPRIDDHLRCAKSLLLSIQEEDAVEKDSELVCSNNLKSTAFTIPFCSGTVTKDCQDQPTVSKFIKPNVPEFRKISPRRKVKVSPTLKKACSTLLKAQKTSNNKTEAPKTNLRRQSIGAISKSTDKADRRLSMGLLGSKAPLSSRLPESRLSLSRKEQPVFKIPRGSKRIAQMQAAKSEILHNLDDILSEVTNVDAFAASTTSDPFLNQAIYNDSAWMARQETDMIKWLNALLTPPAELETNTDQQVINIGDLWQKTCRQKDVSFAPSREEVSSDHYNQNSRLNTLRKGALTLIRSGDVASVLQKISVRVDQKVLSVREDRDLHLDVGLQHSVLELLLCYNPLWLRIGLEAVYGKTVPLKSNCDYVGLTAFVVHNLLSDDHIVATFSHPTVPHLRLPGFQVEMKKFTLKKFLFVVFFLDRAKTAKLIGHDPCLFIRSAKYKESREIVLAFARDLLSGIGDVNRFLSSLGCKLTVKQTYLDEFEYAVKNLLDLRDGIRLVRVMELILCNQSLHLGLRVPAISRLQKVHNVELALDALKAAGYELGGGICAKDIVDGHREKTLSLLWQLIYKFQAPRFTSAAETIQRWWRRRCLPLEIERRIRARKRAAREAAATTLQTAWRGRLARRRVAALREEHARLQHARLCAAVVLQKHWRRHAAEKVLRRARGAANTIARWYRGVAETRRCRSDFLRKRAAAVLIQAHVRGMLMRRRFTALRRMAAALRVQTWFRRRRAARLFLAAVPLARAWAQEAEEHRRRDAACRRLQARVRAWLQMRRDRERFLAVRAAALAVQRRWRAQRAMLACRRHWLALRGAAAAVQTRWRAVRAMRAQRAAAVAVQRRWRATLLARRQRRDFVLLREAARVVQGRWRGRRLTRTLREDFLARRRAAVTLQRAFRARLARVAGREDRRRFLALRAAAVTVQRWVRARAQLRHQRSAQEERAALCLQRRWRARRAMRTARGEFVGLRAAACVLQRRYRALRVMREQRDRFQQLHSAVVVVQRRYRALLAMRLESNRYHCVLKAVVTIQCRWRAQAAMRKQRADFKALRSAACVFQNRYRALQAMRLERSRYLQVLAAVNTIQTHFRATRLARADQSRYCEVRQAALTIQCHWRAQQAMKVERNNFITLRSAAFTLQQRYRASRAMKLELMKYQQLRSAVINVQRLFRANRLMKEQRSRYLRLYKASVTVQRKWRAQLVMTLERARFSALRQAAISVQRHWRAKSVTRKQSEEFQKLRTSTILIQRWWRASVLARKERQHYQLMQTSAIVIQVAWRAKKLMVQLREEYLAMMKATIVMQKYTRGFLARKRYHREKEEQSNQEYLRDTSARLIQSAWKKWHYRRVAIKQKTRAAIKIQAFWRGYLSRKKFDEETSKLRDLNKELNANVAEPQCMKDRIGLLCFELEAETVGGVVCTLNALNTISLISPDLCEEMVYNDIVAKLFNILCSVNRGVADSEMAKLSTKILLQLCKYSKTSDAVWQNGAYLNLYPHLMKKWISVNNSVLLYFITMLWHFSQSPQKAQVILADEKLKSTILFFLSKYKNKKSKTPNTSAMLPSLVPNWGSMKKDARPFCFDDPLYGLRALCYKLKIDTNA